MKSSFGKMSDHERNFWAMLGNKMFEARKRKNMTQADLGNLLGIARVSVANIENGRQRMTAYRMYQIETVLEALK